MAKVYDALRRAEEDRKRLLGDESNRPAPLGAEPVGPAVEEIDRKPVWRRGGEVLTPRPDPDGSAELNKRRIALLQPESYVAEQFRALRGRIDAIGTQRELKTISITSAFPGEGKTTCAINLAIVTSMSLGRRVLLVDCDLRRPKVHPALGLKPETGLAEVLYGQGRYDEAEELYKRVLAGRTRLLGADNVRTRWTRNNLALTYLAEGRVDVAEELLTTSLESAERAEGGDADELREQTLVITTNLAALYHEQERYDDAERLYRRTLDLQERSLGRRHPDTLITRGNLGELLADRGETERAETLLLDVLRDKRSVFGDDNPSTLYTLRLLARVYRDAGQPERAEPLLDEVWHDLLRTKGAEHPDTVRARAALDRLRSEAPP